MLYKCFLDKYTIFMMFVCVARLEEGKSSSHRSWKRHVSRKTNTPSAGQHLSFPSLISLSSRSLSLFLSFHNSPTLLSPLLCGSSLPLSRHSLLPFSGFSSPWVALVLCCSSFNCPYFSSSPCPLTSVTFSHLCHLSSFLKHQCKQFSAVCISFRISRCIKCSWISPLCIK